MASVSQTPERFPTLARQVVVLVSMQVCIRVKSGIVGCLLRVSVARMSRSRAAA